jgi:NAD(P)H-flavin reductase/ferredoxin
MPYIRYQENNYACNESESVLDCLNRHGVPVLSSCRNGICQTCMMRAINGQPPAEAQKGLKESLRAQNYFLACACKPETDLEVALPGEEIAHRFPAKVLAKKYLNQDILCIRLKVPQPVGYRPGQYINIYRPDGLTRTYSLASLPQQHEPMELHVRKLNGGQMTTWLHDELQAGDDLEISDAIGECFYIPGDQEQHMLLVGTGCGLSPLYGIIRDALAHEHKGQIHLFHGSRTIEGLYLIDELKTLEQQHVNFTYTPCISGKVVPEGYTHGRANDVALAAHPDLKDWRIYLCGHPNMVSDLKKKAFLAGASLKEIFADPFVFSCEPVNDQSVNERKSQVSA